MKKQWVCPKCKDGTNPVWYSVPLPWPSIENQIGCSIMMFCRSCDFENEFESVYDWFYDEFNEEVLEETGKTLEDLKIVKSSRLMELFGYKS